MKRFLNSLLALPLALLVLPLAAVQSQQSQQSLAVRLRDVGTRTVAFSVRARSGVCGDGTTSYSDGLGGPRTRFYQTSSADSYNFVSYGSGSFSSISSNGVLLMTHEPWDNRVAPCEPGPVRVTVRMVDAKPSWVHVAAGPLPVLGDTVLDLGMVSTADAGAFLQSLARADDGRPSSDAIMPLVLIDSVPRWEILASAARDTTRLLRYRRRASDLLARAAASSIPSETGTDDATASIRREAVYAFARQEEKAMNQVPELLRIARDNPHRDARVAALYQLGQTSDPRAVDLFRQMLRGTP